MKSLVTRLMLIALLCYQCRGQSPEQHLAYAVDASIAKMEALSQRFEEMGNQLNTKVEEMGTQMNIKFEELHERMMTMEEVSCDPPAMVIESLGCVIPVNTLMSWEDAKENCQTKGARLLEGITTQSELDQLKQHFISITQNRYLVWVGMQLEKWIGTGNAIGTSSPLWGSGEPGSGQDCGMVYLPATRPYIGDGTCHIKRPSLCQKS